MRIWERAGHSGRWFNVFCDDGTQPPFLVTSNPICFCWDAVQRQASAPTQPRSRLRPGLVIRDMSRSSGSCAAMRRLCDATRPTGTDLLLRPLCVGTPPGRGGGERAATPVVRTNPSTFPPPSKGRAEGFGPERCNRNGGSCKMQRLMLAELITARMPCDAATCRLR